MIGWQLLSEQEDDLQRKMIHTHTHNSHTCVCVCVTHTRVCITVYVCVLVRWAGAAGPLRVGRSHPTA